MEKDIREFLEALKYIPVAVRTKKVKTKQDWAEIFALLRDTIDMNKHKRK